MSGLRNALTRASIAVGTTQHVATKEKEFGSKTAVPQRWTHLLLFILPSTHCLQIPWRLFQALSHLRQILLLNLNPTYLEAQLWARASGALVVFLSQLSLMDWYGISDHEGLFFHSNKKASRHFKNNEELQKYWTMNFLEWQEGMN